MIWRQNFACVNECTGTVEKNSFPAEQLVITAICVQHSDSKLLLHKTDIFPFS